MATPVIPPEAVLVEVPAPDGGAPLRHIRHPGPADARVDVVPCRIRPLTLPALPAGASLIDALAQALAAQGAHSAVLRVDAAAAWCFDPYPYVLPALSRDAAHAVYFSERHQAPGAVRVLAGAITVGRHGERPWLHGHLDWLEDGADGTPPRRGCGHVLPDQARLAQPSGRLEAWALQGAGFEVTPDAWTAFSLFKPRPWAMARAEPDDDSRPALAIRVPPNLDLCHALEAVCRTHGIHHASVRGGVGSTVGVEFDDGPGPTRQVRPFVTETLVRAGRIAPGADGQPHAAIDVTLIDYLGGRHEGRLARGRNPVLVTFELVLEIEDTG